MEKNTRLVRWRALYIMHCPCMGSVNH